MPRTIPAAILSKLKAEHQEDAVIAMVEITHPSWGEPIRLANYTEDITSNGHVFTGFPFQLQLPDDNQSVPRGRISIQNVDRAIGIFLQVLSTPPRIRMIVIVASYPDTYLVDYKNLFLRNFRGDTQQITADIDTWDFSTEPWPTARANQEDFPGLFL